MTPGHEPGSVLERCFGSVPGVEVSLAVEWLEGGPPLAVHTPEQVLRTASLAKIALLLEVAARLCEGRLDPGHPVRREADLAVADSGIWQHLHLDVLPLADAAALVGIASDNWATNCLISLVGLDSVATRLTAIGAPGIQLHDRLRDVRGPEHPATLSTGSAAEWVRALRWLHAHAGTPQSPARRVLDWLRPGVDLSMVGAAFGLDPLAHMEPDRGLRVISKTGTSPGVRADVGIVTGPAGSVVYACLVNWREADGGRDEVLAGMRQIGSVIRAHVTG